MQKLEHKPFLACAAVFGTDAPKSHIIKAGQDAVAVLYGAEAGTNLDILRYKRFREKTASARASPVDVRTLPPTSAAAQEHSLRVNLQVKQWMGEHPDPTDWGWKLSGQQLVPVYAALPPAPLSVLRGVRCRCASGCEAGGRCTCRKFGLECSAACTKCNGAMCTNIQDSTDDL